jgi:hypothetical protein
MMLAWSNWLRMDTSRCASAISLGLMHERLICFTTTWRKTSRACTESVGAMAGDDQPLSTAFVGAVAGGAACLPGYDLLPTV